MGWRNMWVDEGECKHCTYLGYPIDMSFKSGVTRVGRKENTGFCMIYWDDCTCDKCGRKWEEQH